MSKSKRLPITLLTGFLGSGKTSLLQRALADPRMGRTAVIINEIGEVGIDHLLVGKLDDDAILLKSGCLCCSLKNDFSETLLSLYNRRESGKFPPFERVIVETTGLADPVPLLRLLLSSEPLNTYYSVRGIVTTVDTMIDLDVEVSREERIRQIALADSIVLTKTDLAHSESVDAVASTVQRINSRATINLGCENNEVMSVLLDDRRYPTTSEAPGGFRYISPFKEGAALHARVGTCCLFRENPLPWQGLVSFFRAVALKYGNRMLRMKGLLNIEESSLPVVVHGVERYLFPETFLDEWPDSDTRSRIVFIVEDINESELSELLDEHCNYASK